MLPFKNTNRSRDPACPSLSLSPICQSGCRLAVSPLGILEGHSCLEHPGGGLGGVLQGVHAP